MSTPVTVDQPAADLGGGRQWCFGARILFGKEYGDRMDEFRRRIGFACPCTQGQLCMLLPVPTQDADVVEQSPYAARDICVLCGARPLWDHDGRVIAWARPMTSEAGLHKHETLLGR